MKLNWLLQAAVNEAKTTQASMQEACVPDQVGDKLAGEAGRRNCFEGQQKNSDMSK